MDPMSIKLASLRLAPVQVATWGHPETTGLPTIDYYLSAEELEPPNARENYTEQLITLPNLGCFYRPWGSEATRPDLGKLGIDPRSPLFICPGMPFKYAPQHDWVFAEIARRLSRCQFIFFIPEVSNLVGILRRRLEGVFTQYGLNIDEHVVFIPWLNGPAFDGLLDRADVFLDTIGFSGFNTAMQAVERGIPIVTREGRFLRGRLASGILRRMGLQELIAASEEDYVSLAVKLIRDGEYRERTRKRIEADRHVLFEDIAPIRALESFQKNVAVRLDALAGALAIFTVPDEFDREGNIIFLRRGDQLLQSHPSQDAARQPAAQKPPFPSHDRDPALDRLHCGVETGEADGVQENIGTIEQSVKRRAVQPRNEDNVFIDVQAILGEDTFKSPPQYSHQIAHLRYEEDELAPAQPAGDFGKNPIVLRCVFEWHAGAYKKRRPGVDAQLAQVGTGGFTPPGPIETPQIGQGNELFRVVLPRVRRLQFFRGQVIIDRRQPGRLGMSPRRPLHRSTA